MYGIGLKREIIVMELIKQIKTALILLVFFTILTGLIYPLLVTGIAQTIFPWQANGKLINHDNKIIGSVLIGQSFTDAKYFWGRPSATTPFPYNPASSTGSNLGPSNPDFIKAVNDRVTTLKQVDPQNINAIPVDLVTASGSGLDPEISPQAALYQINRIAKARGLAPETIKQLIETNIIDRTFNILGESRVNVLQLNLALDKLPQQSRYL